ncbi:hypothetical protein SALBM311S_07495 [Streptomyces alboniger]
MWKPKYLVMTWKYFGFHMMLYLAGLQSIPAELTEAALIDGASAWQRFRNVTLPLLAPTLRISVFLAVIGSIQLFDLVWVITQGGPDHHSETMAVTMFQYGLSATRSATPARSAWSCSASASSSPSPTSGSCSAATW